MVDCLVIQQASGGVMIKNNCKEYNLITLCMNCNLKANTNIDYWYAYYTYKIGDIYG